MSKNYRDTEELHCITRTAAQEGFSGRAAICPDQSASIHASFARSPGKVAIARKVIPAFNRAQGVEAASIDGKMLDTPHLKRAHKILAAREPYSR